MDRRSLLKGAVALGLAAGAGVGMAEEQQDTVKAAPAPAKPEPAGDFYEEPAKRLPAGRFDVVVAGGGTAGVMAAIAAHVIKWGDGANGGRMFKGEKWDHCRFVDIDRDGDLDILGNCEEHYNEKKETIIGVVWLENPGKGVSHRESKP